MNNMKNIHNMNNENGIIIESFVREITYEEVDNILKSLHQEDVGLITEWGAVIPKNAKYIVEFAEESKYYFATIGMLARSRDEAFVRLKHDVNEVIDNLLEFKDVFIMKEL